MNAVSCGVDASADLSVQPVALWFYHNNGTAQAQTVICRPSITVFDVIAVVWVNNGNLSGVQEVDHYTKPNNVTGSPQNGQAFNAYVT